MRIEHKAVVDPPDRLLQAGDLVGACAGLRRA
jgi:hypothetical protein